MSDKKTLESLRSGHVTFLNKNSNAPQPLRRNPYISHALYNAFDRLKRKPKATRRVENRGARTANRGAVLSNRGANLKRGSANRRATLNAKNKEKEKLMQVIEEEIQIKKSRINRARRAKERAASSEAAAGASANANAEAQEVAVEQEMAAIAELADMLATLRIRNNNNSNNNSFINATKPWLRDNSNEEE